MGDREITTAERAITLRRDDQSDAGGPRPWGKARAGPVHGVVGGSTKPSMRLWGPVNDGAGATVTGAWNADRQIGHCPDSFAVEGAGVETPVVSA